MVHIFSDETAVKVCSFNFSYNYSKNHSNLNSAAKHVLKNISFEVLRGEKVSIIGPNGAGKSTLLMSISALIDDNNLAVKQKKEKQNSDGIYIFGEKVNEKNAYAIREKIGYVFQNPDDQLFSTSVFDDTAFGLINFLYKKKDIRYKDKQFIKDKVIHTLNKVNLIDKENEIPHFLSFGEKKLAALASVLSYDPEILILDEPSSNLDPRNRINFINIVNSLDKTIIIATHDMDLAYEFSERCIILNAGEIVFDGRTKEILRDRAFLLSKGLDIPFALK